MNARATARAPLSLAVLVSGRGSNLSALLGAQARGDLPVRFAGVFSDRPECDALAIARAAGVPALALSPAAFASREDFDSALFTAIDAVQPDLIVCAGYMRLISRDAVETHEPRMINIHPSLLPDYPGLRTHARVLAAGDRVHGASVHRLTAELDAGDVIAQARIDVQPGDSKASLAARVLEREHPLLVATVRAFALGNLSCSPTAIHWQGNLLRQPLSLNDMNQLEETP